MFGRLVEVGEYVNEGDPSPYSTMTYGYNLLDLLTSVLDANGKATTVNYDSLGRKTSMSDPSMGTWSYAYHVNGALQRQNDAKGQWIEFDYDSLDRLVRKRYSDTTKVEYFYDQVRTGFYNAGQRTFMARYTTTAAGGGELSSSTFNYDLRGRQKQVDYKIAALSATARTFQYNYDSADRISSIVYPTGETVSYSYDAAGRQTSVCGTTCYATGAQYTAADQPKSFTFGNNLVQNYEYEAVTQRLWKLKVGTTTNSTSVSSRTYGYDAVGNVLDLNSTTTNENQHFDYDHLDRLKTWTVKNGTTGATTVDQTYTYDKLGNILTKGGTTAPTTYNYNSAATANGGPYAIRSLNGGVVFGYDANGNMTSSPATPFGDPARTLSWNVENLPQSITSGAVTESYTYDADGERDSRAVTQSSVTATTFYFGGMYEEDKPSGNTRSLFTLNGQVVAQKEFVPTPPTPTNTPSPTNTPTNTPTPTATPVYNAAFVSQSVPDAMIAGQSYEVSVTLQNTGLTGWGSTVALTAAGGKSSPWVPNAVNVPSGVTVAPGQSYTFNFTVTAPSTTGNYAWLWNMTRQAGTIMFGQGTPEDVYVSVTADGGGGGGDPCPMCGMSSASGDVAGAEAGASVAGGLEGTETIVYIHSDHLGSVNTTTNQSGAVVSSQQFDPWGKVRNGGISVTDLNYTGQRKDDTGLLYYHARYYDPALARFTSPDTIVPETPSLTASYHSMDADS
ncbi:MAG TPA: RHS repeat-associated core domain-containing protein [Chloroflexia bacterium]